MHYRCSFCNKGQEEVRRLIAGPSQVYICDECVQLCREIIEERAQARLAHDLKQSGYSVRRRVSPMMQRKKLEEIAAAVQGVPVWGCLPGSTAAEAGVRYGDIVLSLNGVATDSFEAFLCAHDTNSGELAIEVFRDGARLAFTMSVPRRRAQKAPPADASMC